ncbi:putative fungal-specific transcription factor domain protein [Podospora australis]|uniref:Fungal-specific transcription factor domain protein n=1 Tax=Podospora australis TaxID=1536484 RepID=A0AAN6WTK5_9PEZI|nr:putative fungal-specific transcription factor domain protein [Podospora australis]
MSSKRPFQEADSATTRSKRAKYSSIACQECRNRKLKCERQPGDRVCVRCTTNDLQCNIARPQRNDGRTTQGSSSVEAVEEAPSSMVRLARLEAELSLLRQQVAELTSAFGNSNDKPQHTPSSHHVHGDVEPVEPHFVGTTRPAFSLKMAKASLVNMGVTSPEDEAGIDLPPPSSPSQDFDGTNPLISLSLHEVQRLMSVFLDEIQIIYPILDAPSALELRIPYLYEAVSTKRFGRFTGTKDQKETHLLKAMVATALVLEQPRDMTLSQALIVSVEEEAGKMAAHAHVDLAEIRICTIMAIYQFFCDQELYAWRTIGIAARLAVEMGLHRKESLFENFPDEKERMSALSLFWCVYVLDRRWGLGNGLPFALVDRDIDPELPEPDADLPYLRSLVAYGRLCSKVWEALPQFSHQAFQPAMASSTASQLDYEIRIWCAAVPAEFKPAASSYPGSSSPQHPPTPLSRGPATCRTLMHLRGNHLRLVVHRQYVLSSSIIASHPHQARLAVQIARDTIRTTVSLSKETDIYARQQPAYNHFLVGALAVMLLAVSHAPGLYAHACRDDFGQAIELVRNFSGSSVAGRKLWKSMCGLVSAVNRLCGDHDDGRVHHDSHDNNSGFDGLGDLFDPEIYVRQGQPDMMHVGVDLIGLFDAFGGHGHHQKGFSYPIQAEDGGGGEDMQVAAEGYNGNETGVVEGGGQRFLEDSSSVLLSDQEGGQGESHEGIDEISRFFMGLI